MRILLDTNVFRNLAWEDRSQISEPVVGELERAGRGRALWCSTVTISELAGRLGPDEREFPRFRDCFRWMERLFYVTLAAQSRFA
jgi:predicted nucleic acid-binding protein